MGLHSRVRESQAWRDGGPALGYGRQRAAQECRAAMRFLRTDADLDFYSSSRPRADRHPI